MPVPSTGRLFRDLMDGILADFTKRLRPAIGSRTLRAALTSSKDFNNLRGALTIPHYWAPYYHDGSRSFGPRRAKWLVWFVNPKDDPRTNYGTKYPVRESDVKRLTKEQFRQGRLRNRIRQGRGLPPSMIVRKFHAGYKSHPFFYNVLNLSSVNYAEKVARPVIERFLKDLDAAARERSKGTIRIRVHL